MYSVMIVDDEELILKTMQRIFRLYDDLNVEYFSSPAAALQRCQVAVFDVILSDYRMPEMDGVEFLVQVRKYQPDAIRLILSAHVDINCLMKAVNEAGIDKFLTKPWGNNALVDAIYQASKKRATLLENRILSDMVRSNPEGPFHYARR